jgi:hypothetical protein
MNRRLLWILLVVLIFAGFTLTKSLSTKQYVGMLLLFVAGGLSEYLQTGRSMSRKKR